MWDKTCASDPSHHYSSSLFSDPFMYYSIPAVHKASLLFTDIDYSDIVTSNRQADFDSHASQVQVSRRTRVSFECHPSVLMEDIMNEFEEEFDEQSLHFDTISILESRLSK